MISITDAAAEKVKDILISYQKANEPELRLRVYVQGGGCSGFQYGFSLDNGTEEDDFVLEVNGVAVVVDSMSMQYLEGATLDYKEDLMSSQFVVRNPNASGHCGCGSSFSV